MTDWKEYKEKIIDIVVKNLNIATTYEEALKSYMNDVCPNSGEDDGTPSEERAAGQREAWELVRKIIVCEDNDGYSGDTLREIFGTVKYTEIFCDLTYAEAAEKVKAWEDSKVFKVGDVVTITGYHGYGVVTETGGSWVLGITDEGVNFQWHKESVVKTGRTLPVSDWLRQIGGEE